MGGRISNPEIWTAEKIIELIQGGRLPPWSKSWSTSAIKAPRNLANLKIPYRGSWKGKDGDEEERTTFVCKAYRVFNVKQTDIPEEKLPEIVAGPETFAHTPIEMCEKIVEGYANGPEVIHQGQQPLYRPSEDRIFIPARNRFHVPEEYYSTLFHEMVHSTGHSSRLNREAVGSSRFGSHAYSQEELVAEFGSAMLCGRAGIAMKTIENSAAYIKGWGLGLKPDMLVLGSREARKAFERVLGEAAAKEEAA